MILGRDYSPTSSSHRKKTEPEEQSRTMTTLSPKKQPKIKFSSIRQPEFKISRNKGSSSIRPLSATFDIEDQI